MYRSYSQSMHKLRMSLFFCWVAICFSMCSWLTEAFQFSSYPGVTLSRLSVQRSLPGLFSPSSIRSDKRVLQMATTQGEDTNKGIWGIPSWISGTLFSNSEVERSHTSLRRRLADSSLSQYSTSNSIQIPGFMDYDPKTAAQTAHRAQSRSSSNSGWFRW